MEDYPRNLAEFEARFANEQACRSICVNSAGRRVFVVRDAGMTKPGRYARCCCSALVAGIKLRPRQAQYFKTPANRSRAGFEPCGGSPARRTGPAHWDCNERWAWAATRRPGLGCTSSGALWYGPDSDRLSGRVEVDETYLGALEEGVRGRQTDAKALIAVAAEEDGAGIGRIRMRTIPNASGDSLMAFVASRSNPAAWSTPTVGWVTGHSKATAIATR